ncbi:MAG: inorganic phosphate transporter [Bacilli bacterium]|nr:inorganic phosphate transporter [Bacilli bacterium]
MLTLMIITVLFALAFDFTNGFHDTANAIATSVSTKALPPRLAVIYAAVANFAGAYTFTGVAKTIGGSIADPLQIHHGVIVVLAAVIAAISWNLMTWAKGIPSSSSHALIGALTGAVISSAGWHAINVKGFTTILQGLIISPFAAFAIGFILMIIFKYLFANTAPRKVNHWFRRMQWISAGLQAFWHGTNDAQKSMGIIAFALVAAGIQPKLDIPLWVKLLCALAMALGTLSGGWRIIRTVGTKIIKLEPLTGFTADLSSIATNFTATMLKLPVSTTHIISSSIMGVGSAHRFRAVKWGVAGQIVFSWIITIPISACIAAIIFQVFKLFL